MPEDARPLPHSSNSYQAKNEPKTPFVRSGTPQLKDTRFSTRRNQEFFLKNLDLML